MTTFRISAPHAILTACCLVQGLAAAEYVVAPAPKGDDANPGTSAKPFATVQKAASVAAAGDTVTIKAGIYRETVTPANSGSAGSPIVFRAAKGEKVVISGADVVAGWKVDKGQVWKADAGPAFASQFGQAEQVFVDGKMMLLARWPNDPKIDPSSPVFSTLTEHGSRSGNGTFTGNITDVAIKPSTDGFYNGAEIFLLPSNYFGEGSGTWSWTVTGKVTSHKGAKLAFSTIDGETADGSHNGAPYVKGARYYLYNLRSLLDAPGEWWLDTASRTVYLQAPDSGDPNGKLVEMKKRDYAFVLTGKSYITIKDIGLFAASLTTDNPAGNRGAGVPGSSNVTIEGMRASYINHSTDCAGTYGGVQANFMNEWGQVTGLVLHGTNHVIKDSVIRYSSGNGISLLGSKLTVTNNIIEDVNYTATDCGFVYTGWIGKVTDSEISYNTMRRAGRSGVMIRGLRNSSTAQPSDFVSRVHHNEVIDWGMQDRDVGAFYTFGNEQTAMSGTFVRIDHNLMYCTDPNPVSWLMGAYWDYSRNYVFDHNVVFGVVKGINNTGTSAGKNNTIVFNNTVVVQGDYGYSMNNAKKDTGCIVKYNLLNVVTWKNWQHWPNYNMSKIDTPDVKLNLVWGDKQGSGKDGTDPGLYKNDVHIKDPNFVNPEARDFRLAEGSPAIDAVEPMQDVTVDGVKVPTGSWNDPANGKPDAGAFEFGKDAWVPGAKIPGEVTAANPVAAQAATPEAAPAAVKMTAKPEALLAWEAKLLARVKEAVAAHRGPQCSIAMGRDRVLATVESVSDDLVLELRLPAAMGGSVMTQPWKRIDDRNRLELAKSLKRGLTPEDNALIAFYALLVDDRAAADEALPLAGLQADEVKKAFEAAK